MTMVWGGLGDHPLEIDRGGDPPDRVVRCGDCIEAVELTELTVTQIRQDYARARQLGREVEKRLQQNAEDFGHLLGRQVQLSILRAEGLPYDIQPLANDVSRALLVNRGWVGDGVDMVNGFPQQWPNDRGFYGEFGPVTVMVNRGDDNDRIVVSSCSQAEIRLSETLREIKDRIQNKDIPSNSLLLVTTGLPDNQGSICPADQFMFDFLKEHRDRVELNPRHLKGVIAHKWGTTESFYLYRSTVSCTRTVIT